MNRSYKVKVVQKLIEENVRYIPGGSKEPGPE
jgi:hypothetical protein